ncbi:carboxylesterase family protein [Mangrovimonas xylaniphaga]|uniref:carboxylesterase family protein n=1 Tax=Mangrovimonas xylaniphaga TaxID=1645915 RepID=UPI0006B67810|nr:alpha/beta hydrolase-fold protein [Mangrovimonas xylaniphaga]
MKNRLKVYVFLCLLLSAGSIIAQQEFYQKQLFIHGNDTLKYRIMYPKDFSESKQYPLLLFLHGAGERGSDNTSQLVHGSALFANEKNREDFPAIVIFPQCPKESYWANADVDRSSYPISLKFPKDAAPTPAMDMVLKLMDAFTVKSFVKKEQVYVGGLSMGGMGTFEILSRRPDMFAGAIAICGGGNTELAENYATKVPMWIFHGANDDVVRPQLSIDMVSAILKYGGKPNFNLYAKDNHNSWDSTFAEPGLLPWLFSQSKL